MLCQIACYKHKELNLRQFNKICCERRKSAASVEDLMLLWQQSCLLRFAMLLVCFASQCCLVWLDCFAWLDFAMSPCLIHFAMLLLSDSLRNVVSRALLSCSSLRSNALTNLRFCIEWRFFASSLSDDSSLLHEWWFFASSWVTILRSFMKLFLLMSDSLAAFTSSYSLFLLMTA